MLGLMRTPCISADFIASSCAFFKNIQRHNTKSFDLRFELCKSRKSVSLARERTEVQMHNEIHLSRTERQETFKIVAAQFLNCIRSRVSDNKTQRTPRDSATTVSAVTRDGTTVIAVLKGSVFKMALRHMGNLDEYQLNIIFSKINCTVPPSIVHFLSLGQKSFCPWQFSM